MDFTFANEKRPEYNIDQYIAVLLAHPLCPATIRRSFVDHKTAAPPGVTYQEAFNRFQAHVQSKREAGHPVATVAAVVAEHPVIVTPSAISVVKPASTVQTHEYARGYYVPATKRAQSISAAVADAYAYTYTPIQTVPKDAMLSSNFQADRRAAGVPLISTVTRVGESFKASDSLHNAEAVFEQLKVKDGLAKGMVMVAPVISALISEGHQVSGPIVVANGKKIQGPGVFVPKAKRCPDAATMYQVIALHRTARGEDRKWLSPLTAGYYLGAMPRQMETVWWRAVDILETARRINVRIIVFENPASALLYRTLAANGLIVVYLSYAAVDYLSPKEARARIMSCMKVVSAHGDMSAVDCVKLVTEPIPVPPHTVSAIYDIPEVMVVMEGIKATTVYANKTTKQTPEFIASKKVVETKRRPTMVWWPIADFVFEYAHKVQGHIYPSVHAHSGSLIAVFHVVEKQKLDVHDLPWYASRCVTANVYKTYYPYAHTRFLEADNRVFKYVNSAAFAVRMHLHVTRKERVAIRLEDYEEDEDESELATEFTHMVIELNEKEVPLPVVAPYQIPPSSVESAQWAEVLPQSKTHEEDDDDDDRDEDDYEEEEEQDYEKDDEEEPQDKVEFILDNIDTY